MSAEQLPPRPPQVANKEPSSPLLHVVPPEIATEKNDGSQLHAGQNSRLRRLFKHPADTAGSWIDSNFPGVSSNDISVAAIVTVGAGTLIAARAKTWKGRWAGAAIAAAGNVGDMLDGAHSRARKKRLAAETAAGKEQPVKETKDRKGVAGYFQEIGKDGGLVDFLGDRADELLMTAGRLYVAHKRESLLGVAAAIGAAETNALPSEQRARAEQKGRVVPEGDKIGTRPGRAVTGVLGLAVPELQPALDLITIASSLRTTHHRRDIVHAEGYNGVPLDEQQQHAAGERLKYITDIKTGVHAAVALVTVFSTTEHAIKKYKEKKKISS